MIDRNMDNAPKNGETRGKMSWVIVFILMVLLWPIGMLLLLYKLNTYAKPELRAGKQKGTKAENSPGQPGAEYKNDAHDIVFAASERLREAKLYTRGDIAENTQIVREARAAAYQVILELHADLAREESKQVSPSPKDASADNTSLSDTQHENPQTKPAQNKNLSIPEDQILPQKPQSIKTDLPQDEAAEPQTTWKSIFKSRNAKARIKTQRTALEKRTGKAVKVVMVLICVSHFLLGGNAVVRAVWEIYSAGINRWPEIYLGIFHFVGGIVSYHLRSLAAKRYAEYKRYLLFVSGRQVVPIPEIARAAGVSDRIVKRDIRAMINEGYLARGAYIDEEFNCIIFSDEMVEVAGHAAFAAEDELMPQQDVKKESRNTAIIRELREIKGSIFDISMAKKIYRIEIVTVKILRAADENPNKHAQIRRFVNYYLPTTLRLMGVCVLLETQGVRIENVFAARESVRGMLDTIAAGFERHLEQIQKSDDEDIDISDFEQIEE